MATKKEQFQNINFDPVSSMVQEVTADPEEEVIVTEPKKERKTYTKAEQDKFLAELKTAGRKGCKLPRINLAFTPDNYDFIKVVSRMLGMNMTEFINILIKDSFDKYEKIYKQSKKLIKDMEKGNI